MTYYNYLGIAMPESANPTSFLNGTDPDGGEVLTAPPGPSSVSGDGGGDTLVGSTGDNTFYIANPDDVVQVAPDSGGTDTVIAYTSYTLPDNVQNLDVSGDFNYAVGNGENNLITVTGDQWVYDPGGNNVFVGGSGDAHFQIDADQGNDVIYDFHLGDQIRFSGTAFTNFSAVQAAMTQVNSDVVIQVDPTDTLTIRDTTISQLTSQEFLLPLDTRLLGALTFDDEFNALSLYDPSTGTGTWQTNFGGNLKDGWAYTLESNGELESYVTSDFRGRGDQPIGYNPFSVSNGVLSITAEPIPAAQQQGVYDGSYYSGMLNTLGSFSQQYGYFEINAAFPDVPGTWPGFWLEPNPWIPNSEADITEHLGGTPNVDYVRAWGGDGSDQSLYDNVYMTDPTGFHTYGLLWTPTTVTYYLDGVAVMEGPTPSSWTQPMALIVDLAIGGWEGTPQASEFPASMEIDWVRVYALADGSSVTDYSTPTPPAATIQVDGSPVASMEAAAQIVAVDFDQSAQPVNSSQIVISPSAPDSSTLPPGETFFVWAASGAVYGALAEGGQLVTPTGFMAANTNPFIGGTWLGNGDVALSYLQNDSGVQDLWVLVFDPSTGTVNKQELGPATGDDIHIVATLNDGFAVSWDAGGAIEGMAYSAHAYDGTGWLGPMRALSGDLLGVDSTGELVAVAASDGSTVQLYNIVTPSTTVPASISLSPNEVTETLASSGVTTFTYTVTESYNLTGTPSVTWDVVGNSADPAPASDFQNGVLPSGTITFAPSQSTATITINVVGDSQVGTDDTFAVTLTSISGAVLGTASAEGVIVDNGTTTPAASISLSPSQVTEDLSNSGDAAFTYTVTRSNDLSGSSSVGWDVAGNGANPAPASDFQNGVLPSGTITFAPSQSTATITVDVVADSQVGTDDSFALTLTNVSGAVLGTASALGTIVDNGGGSSSVVDTAAATYIVPAGVEDVVLTGTAAQTVTANSLGDVITSNDYGSTLIGGSGNDRLIAGHGADMLTGGGGADVFVFKYLPWNAGHITDFTLGTDKLDVSALLSAAGYTGGDPVADGYVTFASDGAGDTQVYLNTHNPSDPWPTLITTLDGVAPAGLTAANLLGEAGSSSPPPPPPSTVVDVSAPTYTVPSGVQDVQLTGTAAQAVTANSLGDIITSNDYGSTLIGGSGNDTLIAGHGADMLTGGGGNDTFEFKYLPWNAGHVTDFTPGSDLLDLRGLFSAVGYTGSNPVADGYLTFASDGSDGTKIFVNPHDPSEPWPILVTTLDHVAPAALHTGDYLFV